MARLMKDRNNRYLIEVTQARKYVHCVIKDGCLVRCKKYHLTKLIRNDQHEGGACPYAEWWHPVPEAEYPLAKAVEQFLSNPTGWMITEKARNVLTALKDQKPVSEDDMGDDEVVPLPASAVGEATEGEGDMSKKTKSSKKKATKTKGNGAVKKDRGPTIASVIRNGLKDKHGTEEILKAVKKAFPKSETTPACVAFYKTKMRKAGELPKA